jgi:hypothetical protein
MSSRDATQLCSPDQDHLLLQLPLLVQLGADPEHSKTFSSETRDCGMNRNDSLPVEMQQLLDLLVS